MKPPGGPARAPRVKSDAGAGYAMPRDWRCVSKKHDIESWEAISPRNDQLIPAVITQALEF
jgi:hypothetical protein